MPGDNETRTFLVLYLAVEDVFFVGACPAWRRVPTDAALADAVQPLPLAARPSTVITVSWWQMCPRISNRQWRSSSQPVRQSSWPPPLAAKCCRETTSGIYTKALPHANGHIQHRQRRKPGAQGLQASWEADGHRSENSGYRRASHFFPGVTGEAADEPRGR